MSSVVKPEKFSLSPQVARHDSWLWRKGGQGVAVYSLHTRIIVSNGGVIKLNCEVVDSEMFLRYHIVTHYVSRSVVALVV